MRMIFKSHQSEKIGLYQSLLENTGIPTIIKNEFTDGTWPTDPERPELWVINNDNFDQAIAIIRELEPS